MSKTEIASCGKTTDFYKCKTKQPPASRKRLYSELYKNFIEPQQGQPGK
jgi:hypothetical protein